MSDRFSLLKNGPHVVILGAGASCAAIPNGDRNGNKISAMNGFLDNLGFSDVINQLKIDTKSKNLEDIYMELDDKSKTSINYEEAKTNLENRVRKYMMKFELPMSATIYDFLILGLSKNDLIATFNWDPLLVQSITRISRYTSNTPKIAFLHGNVAAGYCKKCNLFGNQGMRCRRCTSNLADLPLLFPVKNKDYRKDLSIRSAWECFADFLHKAPIVTIFGYSAPVSDQSAIDIMKEAWGNVNDRNLEEIEIIDIRNKDEVIASWKDFIFNTHYTYINSFFHSSISKYPKLSVQSIFAQNMECKFLFQDKGFYEDITSVAEAYKLVEQLDRIEINSEPICNPYIYK